MKTAKEVLREAAHWLALLTLIGAAPAVGAPRAVAQDTVTVTGEVVDLACYLAKGSKGERHKSCAEHCVKEGKPVGLLTDSGDLYLLIDDHDDAAPFDAAKALVAKRAKITGKKFSKGGVQSVLVTSAKAE